MQTLQAILIAAKIVLSLGFLIYASWRDYKTREVSNRVWAYYAPIALALSLCELLLYDSAMLPFMGLSFGVTAFFAILLFYPVFADGVSPLAQYLYPLTIFSNSVLFAAASGIYMILRNVFWHKRAGKSMFEGSLAKESIGKKILVMITGYRVKVDVLKAKWHVYPMEDVEGDSGTRKLVVIPKEEGRDQIVERLSSAIDAKAIDGYVWATPGLPMLIFVTLGLVVALLFGDIVWLLVRAVLI